MATLAIKGHATRGKEVIEILEMLGGKNLNNLDGASNMYYLIGLIVPKILGASKLELDKSHEQFTYFTLEEFEKKFPYKIGDKVCYQPNLQIDTICISEIISMKWADNSVIYFTSNGHSLYACDLQPYKEEIIEEGTNKAVFEGNAQSCDIMNDIIKEEAMEEKGTLEQIDLTRELRIADEVEVILGDYEFVLKDGKTYFVKKKPQYPKTYEECLKILGYNIAHIIPMNHGHNGLLMMKLQRLLIFRDAYWKIAGEQMGLDKPWEPDWGENEGGYRYCIRNQSNKIVLSNEWLGENYILAFPTAEMRDKFYENFKDLIEYCKELL